MRVLILLALMIGCSSTGKEQKPEILVMKYVWVYCWEECGRGNKLIAVSEKSCHCSDGRTLPIVPITLAKVPDRSVVEKFLGYLKGDHEN